MNAKVAKKKNITVEITIPKQLPLGEIVKKTGRKIYWLGNDNNLAQTTGEGGKIKVTFFYLGEARISDSRLAEEYKKRGLKPDFFAQLMVNIRRKKFADKYPNITHWKGEDGWYRSAYFGLRINGERFLKVDTSNPFRGMVVNLNVGEYNGKEVWFAGVKA